MLKNSIFFLLLIGVVSYTGCNEKTDATAPGSIQLVSVRIGDRELNLNNQTINTGMAVNRPVVVTFASPLKIENISSFIRLIQDGSEVPSEYAFLDNDRAVSIIPNTPLRHNTTFTLAISDRLRGKENQTFPGLDITFTTIAAQITITALTIDQQNALGTVPVQQVALTPVIEFTFSAPILPERVISQNIYMTGPTVVPLSYRLSEENKKLTITTTVALRDLSRYSIVINNQLTGPNQETFPGFARQFFTAPSEALKFPEISDDELLTLVQRQTFKYFWDFAHPVSGLARERNTSGNLVTTGGSGFGFMAIIVGIERGFITREQGVAHMEKVVDFLGRADRFHGAWSHWLDGNTGKVIPFSANDDGGDLVETAFLIQGLLTFRQYLQATDIREKALIDKITELWEGVEWDWYRRDGQQTLYWHWSPGKGWAMNMTISGWNESLIVYTLAAASPTHSIPKSVYDQGWARNGAMRNGNTYENIQLPLGYPWGGPLFFAHYSFLGLDPRGLSDAWCSDYFEQNKIHSLINQAYCIRNPKNFMGYSEENWGLTASDNHLGYNAHSPTNDLGVITPTAALSSIPYTPVASMKALKFFYYKLGDRLWGDYGFYDAFNLSEGWIANSFLAIDQGPIVVMIENYRTGLLWDLFMSAPEVHVGLDKLEFTYNK